MSSELKNHYSYTCGQYEIESIVTGKYRENSYLVIDRRNQSCLLVDPGEEIERIQAAIENSACSLTSILLTHAHFDHVGAVKKLQEIYPITCWLKSEDRRLLHRAPLYSIRFIQKTTSVPPSVSYFDGGAFPEDIKLPIKVIATPGHTAGSVTYAGPGFAFTVTLCFLKELDRRIILKAFRMN